MKILQINNYGFVRGGADRYFLDLSELLAWHGHQVSFLCTNDTRNLVAPRYPVAGFDIARPGIRALPHFIYSRDARRKLRRLIEDDRPDIVHLHIYYGQLSASILSLLKAHKIPVVQTLHEYKLLCPIATMIRNGRVCTACANGAYWKAAWHRCNRGGLARSLITGLESYVAGWLGARRSVNHFIAVSDFLRRMMIRHGVPPERISTVHNFIDATLSVPSDLEGSYFLYFGRLEKIKGVMTLLSAMRQAPGKLVIAGDGTARGEMEAYIRRHAMTNVTLVGFKRGEELHRLIQGCRSVIVPSEWYETFGLVLLEAFAAARPVIASRIGGMTEVVTEGKDGLLFTPGSEEELVRAMTWMWENPAEACQWGRDGRLKVENIFTPQRHYEAIMKVYEQAMLACPAPNHSQAHICI